MRKWTLAAFVGLAALCAAPAFGVVTIQIEQGAEPSGTTASVDVTLSSGGDTVGGMQNDILFDTTKVTLASATACRINAAIGTNEPGCEEDPVVGPCKTLSRNLASCGATPTPPGCEGQPANISRFRGIIAATAVPNNNEIPDGTVLYTCDFTVVGDLPATLDNSNVVASNPTGTRLDATGTDGSVGGGVVGPTATVEPTGQPTPGGECPESSCDAAICVDVATVRTTGPGTVSVDIVVTGDNVGGTQNDILFDTSIVTLASATACRINSAIGTNEPGCEEDPVVGPCKTLSRNLASCGTTPTPPGCEGQAATISRFRGIVAATAVPNNNAIPSGSVLYTCDFNVVGNLPAELINENIVASNPTGTRLDAGGANGAICTDGGGPTETPTTPVETPATAIPTVTNTVGPTAIPTATRTIAENTPTEIPTEGPTEEPTPNATDTPDIPFGDDDDGCHISTSGSTGSAWMLLIPTLGLLVLRRNRK